MRELVLTPKFRRAYRKAAKRDRSLQSRIEDTLHQMEADVFHPSLGSQCSPVTCATPRTPAAG